MPPCTLAPCSFQSSGIADVLSSWTECKSAICVCSQAAFVYSICNRDDSLHRVLSGDYCKIYGLIYANSETGWGTGELQSTAERRYHLARPFKATLAVRDDGQRLG